MSSPARHAPRRVRSLTSLTSMASIASMAWMALPTGDARAQAPANVQNVIVMIGNGLGPATTTAARLMRYREDGKLAMDAMPQVARLRTSSLDAQTTDSAAAVSALLTGVRVRNQVVAMDAATRADEFAPGRDPIRGVANAENRCPASGNGGPSRTLLELAIAKNKATGVVTTGRLASGAVGATYAHVCNQAAEFEIARQATSGGAGFNAALGRGVDVMLGGASGTWRPFDAARRPRGRPDGRELVGEMQTQGYTFVQDLATLNAAPTGAGTRLLGLFDFSDDGMSYDGERDPRREPSLAELTSKAIDLLSSNRNGYVLVVEAAHIDRALHATSGRRALTETIAFDDAVKVALERVNLSRTLVIVTGDHDGTLALIGGGRRGSDVLGLHLNPVTGTPDVDVNGATYTSLIFGTGPNRPDKRTTLDTPTVVQKDYLDESTVKLTASTNGGGDVILHAAGAGAASFRGTLDHVRVFALVRKLADL